MTQTSSSQRYQNFLSNRKQLIDLIHRQLKVVDTLTMEKEKEEKKQKVLLKWEKTLHRLEERVNADNFKVLVMGEFRRGKSTLINALLGDEILPAYVTPTTAIINEIKWGDSPRALVYFKDDKGVAKPPEEVSVKELEKYVVIPDDDVDEKQSIRSSPYDKIELFWPLDICSNGVEIIDSPGLNENSIRQKITMDYLSTVDAIVFVLFCEALGSRLELDVIDNIRQMGHEDIFFICNRINQIRPQDQDKVRQHGLSKLAHRTNHGAERVFFINALGALEARINNNKDEFEKSGVAHLEKELEKFLTSDRGRIKLLRPATELKNSIREARRIISESISMLLTEEVENLQVQYEETQEELRDFELKRQQMVGEFNNFRKRIELLIIEQVQQFYQNITDNVDSWLKDYKIQHKIDWRNLHEGVKKCAQEIVEYLTGCIEKEFSTWQSSELQPLLDKEISSYSSKLNKSSDEFMGKVDRLRLHLTGYPLSDFLRLDIDEKDIGERNISALERIVAAGGGLVAGLGIFGISPAVIGGVYGLEEMLKSVVPQIVVGIATSYILLAVLNILEPWLFFPLLFGALAGTGFFHGKWTENAAHKKLKEVITKKFADKLRDTKKEQADEIASAIAKKLNKAQDTINAGLINEIQSLRDLVDFALSEKKKGQANVKEQVKQLETVRQTINGIDRELDELIAEIALL